MFGGIWLGDAQIIDQLGNALSTFVMRVYSAGLYVVFLAIAIWYAKRRQGGLRRFFGVVSIVSLLLYFAGILMVFVLMPNPVLPPENYLAVGWMAFLMTKFIGAPVSIGLVCVFAQLERERVMRMSTLGMLGAFLIYSFAQQAVLGDILAEENAMFVAVLLLGLSCVFGMMGMNDQVKARSDASPNDIVAAGVVRRPMSQVITPGFVIMALFSAMMLGYLRNGYQASDPHMSPISVAALFGLIVVAVAWKGLRMEHVFYSALLCSTAGILLYPILEIFAAGAADIISAVGTALFEVLLWSLAVWATRNSFEMLLAASVSRLIMVAGHLLGTIAVLLGVAVTSTPNDASHASGLIIVFVYVVMLVILSRMPSLQAPFLMTSSENAGSLGIDQITEHEAAVAAGAAETEDASAIDFNKRYWEDPCRTIAATYQLTTREYDVLEQLARGYNLAAMEENLVISHNTMKMHMRHIYTKLDVHSRQDVINMVEQVRAKTA